MERHFIRVGLLIGFAIALASATAAQDSERERQRPVQAQNRDDQTSQAAEDQRPNRPRRERRPGNDDDAADGGREAEGGEGRGEGRFGALPFRPAKADFGPLKQGEDQELMQFAEAEVPEAYLRLDSLRRNAPGEYRKRLRDMAPRLRFLRRIFARQPELGRVLVEHIDATMTIERLVRAYRNQEAGATPRETERKRQEFERRLRERLQKRFEIEERAMDLHVTRLVETRDERIQKRVDELVDPAFELTDERAELKALVEKHRSSSDPAVRGEIHAQLLDAVTKQVDADLENMRERLARTREGREQRTERFMREMLKRGGRGKP